MACMAREIGPKRRGRQPRLAVEIDLGIIGPSIAGGSGRSDLRAEYQNVLTFNDGFRPNKAPVLSGNGEAAKRSTLADESAADMMK